MATIMEKNYHNFRDIFLVICILIIALCFLSILFTFNHNDSGWTHSGVTTKPNNIGGLIGAWISDVSLSFLGFMAYVVPLITLLHGYILYQTQEYPWHRSSIIIYSLGWAFTLVFGTVTIYLHLPRLILNLPYGSSGILGQEIGDLLLLVLTEAQATILSVAVLMLGINILTGLSWLKAIDFIGKYSLFGIDLCIKLFFNVLQFTDKPRVNSPLEAPYSTSDKLLSANNKHRSKKYNRIKKVSAKKIIYIPALPDLGLLGAAKQDIDLNYNSETLNAMSPLVESVLAEFNFKVKVENLLPGPVITRFELSLAAGIRASRISSLSADIARGLSVASLRVVEVIAGKPLIGLEIPNETRQTVVFNDIINSAAFSESNSPLTLAIGKDIAGNPLMLDLAKMPHLLVAGTTGSGKSVAINTMILSMLFKAGADKVRMIMIDPKMLELSVYEGIPHLLAPVVTDMQKASNALNWAVQEMERRYKLMSILGVRNLAKFNQKIEAAMEAGTTIKDPLFKSDSNVIDSKFAPNLDILPNIVIIIDELADMMMLVGKKVEELITRLAQKARAAGIHLILATQRPSVDVLTGLIKANIPTRMSFQVASKIDSRTILDQSGAETLLGNGDLLFLPPGSSVPQRAHGAFVDDEEVYKVVEFLKTTAPTDYNVEITQALQADSEVLKVEKSSNADADSLYEDAVNFVIETRKASISGVQRHFKVGYNRASRMIHAMEIAGIVSLPKQNGLRKVLAESS